mgnify:CR=1 FL=1
MRSVSALLVAFLVVTAGAPVGVAAAASGGTSLSAATATGAAQVQDGGVQAQTTATTPTNGTDTNETATPRGDSTATADETASESNGSGVAPGAKLAGVVAVQGAEINGEVASRAFGQRVAAAATNDSKAAVVAAELNTSQERLETLRARLAETVSLRPFLLVVAATVGGGLVGVSLPLVGGVGAPVGAAVSGFATGVLGGRYYGAVLAAGAVGGAAMALVDHAGLALLWAGPPILTAGAVVGAVAAALGHYFGRDLHAGLTRPLP